MPKSTSLPSIQLSGAQLSDLFFNSELPNIRRQYDLEKSDSSSGHWAHARNVSLEQDAKDFAEMIGNQVDAVDLVRDFLNHL